MERVRRSERAIPEVSTKVGRASDVGGQRGRPADSTVGRTPAGLLSLQQVVGNREVVRLLAQPPPRPQLVVQRRIAPDAFNVFQNPTTPTSQKEVKLFWTTHVAPLAGRLKSQFEEIGKSDEPRMKTLRSGCTNAATTAWAVVDAKPFLAVPAVQALQTLAGS
jgi:hypothetical protein